MNQIKRSSFEQAGHKPTTISEDGYTIQIIEGTNMPKPSNVVKLGKSLYITTDSAQIANAKPEVKDAFDAHFNDPRSSAGCEIFASNIPYAVGVMASLAVENVRNEQPPNVRFLRQQFGLY